MNINEYKLRLMNINTCKWINECRLMNINKWMNEMINER